MPKKGQLHLLLGSGADEPQLASQVPRSPISQDASLAIFKEQRKYGMQQQPLWDREAGSTSSKLQRLSTTTELQPTEGHKSDRPKSMLLSMRSKLRSRQKSDARAKEADKRKAKPTLSLSGEDGLQASQQASGVTKSHSTSAINSLAIAPAQGMPKFSKLPRSKTAETTNNTATPSAAGRFLRLFSLGALSKSKSVELDPDSEAEQDVFIPQGHSVAHRGALVGNAPSQSLQDDHCAFCPDCGGYISDNEALMHSNTNMRRPQYAAMGVAQFNSLGRVPKARQGADKYAQTFPTSDPRRPASVLGDMVASSDESYRFLMRGGESAIRYRRDKASGDVIRSVHVKAEMAERRKSRSLEDLLNPEGKEQTQSDDFASVCSEDDRSKTPTPGGVSEVVEDNDQHTLLSNQHGPSAFKPPTLRSSSGGQPVPVTVANPIYDSVRHLPQPRVWQQDRTSDGVPTKTVRVTAEDYMVHSLDVVRDAERQHIGLGANVDPHYVEDPNDMVQVKEDKSNSSRRTNPRRHTITMGNPHLSHEASHEEDGMAQPHHGPLIGQQQQHSHAVMQRPDLQRSVEQQLYQEHQYQQRRKTTQVVKGSQDRSSSAASHPLPVPTAHAMLPGQQTMPLPAHHSASASDDEGFRRGGRLRASLPVVRSPNMSLNQPLGTVFLVFRNETKRALLPNEITTIDTVRALFVRAFSDYLSLPWFEIPGHKVYIKEPGSDIYYELDNLREIVDKTVLKVVETELMSGTLSPHLHEQHLAGYESDMSSRSAPVRSPATLHRPGSAFEAKQNGGKPHSFGVYDTIHASHLYDHGQVYAGRPHSHYAIPQRSSLSPQHAAMMQRHSASYADPHQYATGYGYHDYQDPATFRSGNATPTMGEEAKDRMDRMENHLAHLTAWVQSTVIHSGGSTAANRPGSAQSTSSLHSEPVSHKSRSDSNVSPVLDHVGQGMSDVSSSTPKALGSLPVHENLSALQQRAHELKLELMRLRRLQMSNSSLTKDAINDVATKIKRIIQIMSGTSASTTRNHRLQISLLFDTYHMDARKVECDLSDLESAVEDVRRDVLNRKCRVNMTEVESFALALSAISKTLADLKAKYPTLRDLLKTTISEDADVVSREEKFVNDEPARLDGALKRCKKLTTTLYTLKRLASVQEQKPVYLPSVQGKDVEVPRVPDSNVANTPDHEDTDGTRERKKKVSTHSEILIYEKALEQAQQQLRVSRLDENDDYQSQLSLDQGLPAALPPKKPPRTGLSENSTSSSQVTGDIEGDSRFQNTDALSPGQQRPDVASARHSFFATMSNNEPNAVNSGRLLSDDRVEVGSADLLCQTNGSAFQCAEKLSDNTVIADNSDRKKVTSLARSVADSKLSPSVDCGTANAPTQFAAKSDVKELKLPSLQLAPREGRLTQPQPRPSQSSQAQTSKTAAPAKVVHIKPQQDIVSVMNQLDFEGNPAAVHTRTDSNGGQELMWGQNLASLALLDEDYDSDSDSTASVESQQSTIRRQLPEFGGRPMQHTTDRSSTDADRTGREDADSRRGGKKVPPPPPVRKASALSTSMNAALSHDSTSAPDRRQETEIY